MGPWPNPEGPVSGPIGFLCAGRIAPFWFNSSACDNWDQSKVAGSLSLWKSHLIGNFLCALLWRVGHFVLIVTNLSIL